MNTNDEKIQWHPAFDAALQIEFGDEAKYLEFDPEHLISKKPMQIDVLVKNEKHVKLRKNIGRIFRQYNIIEYKSPEDDLDIDDFYKTYAYACLYKSDTEAVDLIPADELTITFVCYHYPRNMLRKLEQDRKMTVEQEDSGIYYLIGDAIPIQLVIVPKLSKEHNYWLNNLRNDLKAGSEIKKITESGTTTLQTGGRQIDYNAYIKRLETIDMEYENIRIDTTDISKIAQNTGMPEWKISRIKDHVFSNEHILDAGVKRFDADPEIADAWYRLTNGTYNQNDIDLLNHEYFESKFESFYKTDYRTAHNKTEESGRIWDPYKENN